MIPHWLPTCKHGQMCMLDVRGGASKNWTSSLWWKGAKAMLVMRAAANDFLHYWLICQFFDCIRFVFYIFHKMSKNGEKWRSLLPKAQDATHVLYQWTDHNPKLFSLLERHTRNQKYSHLRRWSSIPAWDFFLFFLFFVIIFLSID